jgi:hypothetical protein
MRALAAGANDANRKYMDAARNSTAAAMKNAGDVLGLEMGNSVDKAVRPTIGAIQGALRQGWQDAKDAANSVNEAGKGAGAQAGIEFRKAVEGVKIAAGIDASSSEGYSEFLRMKFGSTTDDAAERTADAAERTADGVDELASKLDFTVMGMA